MVEVPFVRTNQNVYLRFMSCCTNDVLHRPDFHVLPRLDFVFIVGFNINQLYQFTSNRPVILILALVNQIRNKNPT